MRAESTVASVSWIPSESISGLLRAGFDIGFTHYDDPPPDLLPGPEEVERLRDEDRFRFANVLTGWAEFGDDGRPVEWGVGPGSGLVMGSTTVRLAGVGATFAAGSLPVLRPEPVVGPASVRLLQTVGGRTGVPLPRPVPHPPFAVWQAPVVWTTLALTLHADGTSDVDLLGASAFPRHWVYGPDGRLVAKSGVTDQEGWVAHSFGPRTPWSDKDSPALVAPAESELERRLSELIMRAGRTPEVRRLPAGAVVTQQGAPGDEIFLVLDGVLGVDVDGRRVADVGPGAVLGERAVLEGGTRTSTLVARTPVRLAVAAADAVDLDHLRELSSHHRRED
jgi:hypothetical protein